MKRLSFFISFCFFVSIVALSGCSSKANLALQSTESNQFKIAFGACNRQSKDQSFWKQIAAENPTVFIALGDNVYGEDGNLESIKEAYKELGRNPDYREFREKVPILATWDDHDYGDNDAGRELAFKNQSQELFLEFYDEPLNSERRRRNGIYDATIVGTPGQRVQIIMLDTRWFRTALAKNRGRRKQGDGPYRRDDREEASILGESQWSWLKEQLQMPADIRIIASSIQYVADTHGWETWGNFPRERERMLKLIKETAANGVLFISGDRHHGSLWRFRNSHTYPIQEVTSSSLNHPLPEEYQKQISRRYRVGPTHFNTNYGMIEIDWEDQQVNLRLHDAETGRVLADRKTRFKELKF